MPIVPLSIAPDTAPSVAASAAWVRDLLTGSVGTAIAVLAIAWVGFAMLQGRVSVRDGFRVVVGCFILFGSPIIASAFLQLAMPVGAQLPAAPTHTVAPSVPLPPRPPVFDPYAGASVPNH